MIADSIRESDQVDAHMLARLARVDPTLRANGSAAISSTRQHQGSLFSSSRAGAVPTGYPSWT